MADRVRVTSTQWSDRWAKGLQGAGDKIKSGVEAVKEAPGKKAAEQSALWLQKVTASQGKWERNVAAVTLEDWRQAVITKGIPNLQNSITMGKAKVGKSAEKLIPVLNDLMATAPKRGATVRENLNRVAHFAEGLAARFSA